MMNPYYDERAIRSGQERRMREAEQAVARWRRAPNKPHHFATLSHTLKRLRPKGI